MAKIVHVINKLVTDTIDSLLSVVTFEKKARYSEYNEFDSPLDLVDKNYVDTELNTKIQEYLAVRDRVLTGLVYSRVDDDVNFTAGTYEIGGVPYSAASTNFLDIAASPEGLQRYVRFYATTSNTVEKLEGTASAFAELPDLPASTLSLVYILVNDGGVEGDPVIDLSGYMLKSGGSFSGPIDAPNLSGTNTGDNAPNQNSNDYTDQAIEAALSGGGSGEGGTTVMARSNFDLVFDGVAWFLPMLNSESLPIDTYSIFVIVNGVSLPGAQLDRTFVPNRIYGILDDSEAQILVTYNGIVQGDSTPPGGFPYQFDFNLS